MYTVVVSLTSIAQCVDYCLWNKDKTRLLVGVSSDLVVHHDTVDETLGQQARVLLTQLQSAEPAQVFALEEKAQMFSVALYVIHMLCF